MNIHEEFELHDCPYCGGPGLLEEEHGWCWTAVCLDCGAQTAPFALPPGASDGYHRGTIWWYTWQFLAWTCAGNFVLGWLFPLKREEKSHERIET